MKHLLNDDVTITADNLKKITKLLPKHVAEHISEGCRIWPVRTQFTVDYAIISPDGVTAKIVPGASAESIIHGTFNAATKLFTFKSIWGDSIKVDNTLSHTGDPSEPIGLDIFKTFLETDDSNEVH